MSAVATILPRDLLFLMQKQAHNVFLLDVRDPHEFMYVAIDGAVNIPLKDLPEALSQIPKTKKVVTICHHGMRSMRAAEFLHDHGYDDVASMTGGMNVWSIDVDPSLPRY